MIKIENLSRFIEESPYGSTDWGGTRMVLRTSPGINATTS